MIKANQSNPCSRDDLDLQILSMLGRISIPERNVLQIKRADTLDKDLNLDSLAFIELLIELENTFGFAFDEDYLLMQAYPNVGAVIDYVKQKIG